jgi:hypothetical protein
LILFKFFLVFFCASHSGSDIQDVNTAIAEGKNAVENNAISGQFVGKTEKEIMEKIHAQANCENDREGCKLVGTINTGAQYITDEDGNINWVDVGITTGVGAITGGLGTGFWGTISWNAAGGTLSNQLDGKDPVTGAIIGAGSSTIGYGVGKYAEKGLRPIFNPAANKYIHEINKGFLGITGHFNESSIPAIGGTVADSIFGTMTENYIKEKVGKNKNEKK